MTVAEMPPWFNEAEAAPIAYAIDLLRVHGYVVLTPRGVSKEYVDAGRLKLYPSERQIRFERKHIDLSPCQVRLVEVLVACGSSWCSRDQLRHAMWGDAQPHSDSLAVHMHHLRRKLRELTGFPEPLLSSRREGFRFSPDL